MNCSGGHGGKVDSPADGAPWPEVESGRREDAWWRKRAQERVKRREEEAAG